MRSPFLLGNSARDIFCSSTLYVKAEWCTLRSLTSHLSLLTSNKERRSVHLCTLRLSHFSPLTSHLSPLTSHLSPLSILPEVVLEVENIVFDSFRFHQHIHTLHIIVDFTVVYV